LAARSWIKAFPFATSILFDSIIEFLDPENMQIAVGISLLSFIEAGIQVLPVWRRYLDFLISGFKIEHNQ
jgi:hypothetical protein